MKTRSIFSSESFLTGIIRDIFTPAVVRKIGLSGLYAVGIFLILLQMRSMF